MAGSRGRRRQPDVEDLRLALRTRNTFSGFRSRWTMPFSCAAAQPARDLRRDVDRRFHWQAPPASRSRSVSPSSSSVTANN
jgi:hypothetical protein